MNISISKNEIHNMYNLDSKILSIETASTSTINIGNTELEDSSQISEDAKLQYEYMNRLKGSTSVTNNTSSIGSNTDKSDTFLSKDSIDPSFIEDYALNYVNIRKEISNENSKEEAARKIDLLDKAYSDAINQSAELLSYDFGKFFNYASYEWSYDNSDKTSAKFDTEAFKTNVLSLADKAFSIANQAFKDNNFNGLQANIENELSNISSGSTIESMSYKDIKGVDNFLKAIPSFKNHVSEYLDDGTYKPVAGNWSAEDAANAINKEHSMVEDLLKSGNLSDSTGRKVYNTVLDNISAYHKKFAFGVQMDNDQNEINKDKSYYKLLKEQYEKFEKKLEEARKRNNMKMTLIYLEMLEGLKKSLNEASDKLKEDTDIKNNLSKNPNSVVDTDAYKAISSRENFKEDEKLNLS